MEDECSWGSGPPRGAADPPLAAAGVGGSPSPATLASSSALEEREEEVDKSDPGGGGETEEEGSISSTYLEVLAPPTPRSTGTPTSPQADSELPAEAVRAHASPVSRTSELDTSADSGLTGESEEVRGDESAEDPRQPAPTDVGQPCQPSCLPDMGEEGTDATPKGGCHLRDAHPLSLDLLLPVASHGHNTATGATPDRSEREVFFDLVCEVQSQRLNDQRYSLRKKIQSQRGCHSLPSSPMERIQFFFHSMTSLQTEELFELIARSQSRRLDDQRVDFEGPPGGEEGPKVCGETLEYLDLVGAAGAQADGGPEESPCHLSTSDSTPPPAEQGAPPAEEGKAPAEREVPAEEEEIPANRERIPAEGEVPVEKGDAPAEGEEIPADGGEIPADREEIPKEAEKIPAEGEAPAEEGEAPTGPAEGEEAPAEMWAAPAGKQQNSAAGKGIGAGKRDPDEELYNTILMHQSARARIEDQRSNPPARSPRDFFDLLERLQERRMDEQRAAPPPSLGPGPKRGGSPPADERRPSVFMPLLKGMSQRRTNSN